MLFFYLPRSPASLTANHKRFIQLVARQVVASAVIRAGKLKFVAESRTRVFFAQHVASTCNTFLFFAARPVGHKCSNMHNNGFQLAMQQCYETSWRKMLLLLADPNSGKLMNIAIKWKFLNGDKTSTLSHSDNIENQDGSSENHCSC